VRTIQVGMLHISFYVVMIFLDFVTTLRSLNNTRMFDEKTKQALKAYVYMKLNPVHYDKKSSIESTDYNKTENGFIAQELQKVLPFVVSEGADSDKILSVDYNSIIPILTKGIQEQQLLIEAQQKQIDEMKLMLEKLINDRK